MTTAIAPARRVPGKPRRPASAGASARQRTSPAAAPSAIASIWPNDPPTKTTMATAAANAGALAVRRQALRNAPDRLCDHGVVDPFAPHH
ncbi:hypothetical protein GGI59_000488 [Rhizobium lentis]|uniref:Uncharacterized protein n=1 Tax=Rhizobium lentis TaxID=1138194 RepID=A0A7W8XCV0_9HYPH|nr:hypothetical protein [Rhizobium lentis]MBB5565615.1 hypothetical protein [Rhizobium lentis]